MTNSVELDTLNKTLNKLKMIEEMESRYHDLLNRRYHFDQSLPQPSLTGKEMENLKNLRQANAAIIADLFEDVEVVDEVSPSLDDRKLDEEELSLEELIKLAISIDVRIQGADKVTILIRDPGSQIGASWRTIMMTEHLRDVIIMRLKSVKHLPSAKRGCTVSCQPIDESATTEEVKIYSSMRDALKYTKLTAAIKSTVVEKEEDLR